jgi:transposase
MTARYPEQPLRQLPIDARPVAGEHIDSYIRRLARANHLPPSYLRSYLAGPPGWHGQVQPRRLAVLTGRPAGTLQQTLTARGWPKQAQPPSGRLRRRHADKPALYARIRTAAASETISNYQLAARFRVGRRTVIKALQAPEPPPWKPPVKKQPPAYSAHIDALLRTAPQLTSKQIWEQLLDHTDLKISYDTVQEYQKRRRATTNTGRPAPHRARQA